MGGFVLVGKSSKPSKRRKILRLRDYKNRYGISAFRAKKPLRCNDFLCRFWHRWHLCILKPKAGFYLRRTVHIFRVRYHAFRSPKVVVRQQVFSPYMYIRIRFPSEVKNRPLNAWKIAVPSSVDSASLACYNIHIIEHQNADTKKATAWQVSAFCVPSRKEPCQPIHNRPHTHTCTLKISYRTGGKWVNLARRKKLVNNSGIPQHEIEYIAQCILPDIIALYESEEGQREFQEWKTRREAEASESKKTEAEWPGRCRHQAAPPFMLWGAGAARTALLCCGGEKILAPPIFESKCVTKTIYFGPQIIIHEFRKSHFRNYENHYFGLLKITM